MSRVSNQRGAVALEYILIVALVAIAMIGAFRAWGDKTRENVENVGVHAEGGYDAETGYGGALQPPE